MSETKVILFVDYASGERYEFKGYRSFEAAEKAGQRAIDEGDAHIWGRVVGFTVEEMSSSK